jgi:hypothetical protein
MAIDNQTAAYKRADARDDFYGEDYQRWADEYDRETLAHMWAKEEETMKRLGMGCSCGAHYCDGDHR